MNHSKKILPLAFVVIFSGSCLKPSLAISQVPPNDTSAGNRPVINNGPTSGQAASGANTATLDDTASIALGISMEPFDYDPRGRRDPFQAPIVDKPATPGSMHGPLLALQRYELSQLSLVGIIWDVRRPKAMLKDPSGNMHIVTPNTKIGPRNGYIAVIREGEMVVVETLDQDGRLVSTAQVVKIAK